MSSKASAGSTPSVALIVGVLVLASSTSIMSTDMYAPSLPDLADIFSTTPSMVKLTISLNMLAFGLAQFFYGPLSDRFGRKPILLASLLAVIVLCFACTLANTIEQLIALRILLGLAAAAEAVLGLAIIKDLYTEKQQVKVLAVLNMVIAIAPAVAPIIGGYIHVHFGWTMNFYLLTVMAVVSLVVATLFLPESHEPEVGALQPSRVLRGYTRLFSNQEFMVHTALCGISLGLIFVFVTGAPFVLIELLSVRVDHYGWYQAVMVAAFFIGSLGASRLVETIDTQNLLRGGGGLICVGSAALVLLILLDDVTAASITACYAVMTFGMAGVFAVGPSRALRSVTTQTGSASAMLAGLEQTTAGVAAVVISLFHDGTAKPMAWVTVALACLIIPLLRKSAALNATRNV